MFTDFADLAAILAGIIVFVPIVLGFTLFILIVWLIIRNKRNETDKRAEVVLAAIEKNPDIDAEELQVSMPWSSCFSVQVRIVRWQSSRAMIPIKDSRM